MDGPERWPLVRLLEERAPGRRIADVGCGVGDCALALGKLGFEVLGLDWSPAAIDEAKRRASRASIDARWRVLGQSPQSVWPDEIMDAVIVEGDPGCTSDADYLRLLRRIRRSLTEDGMLIVTARTLPTRTGYKDETKARPALSPKVRPEALEKLASLVREAGFVVEWTRGSARPPNGNDAAFRNIELIARRLPAPPQSLAVASWRTPRGIELDLRYAPDEAALLDPAPTEVWQEVIASTLDAGAALVGTYPVDDPYGAERGAHVVADAFDCVVSSSQLTFGAGVTALLHALSHLADRGLVLAPAFVHPDLEAWAAAEGATINSLPVPMTGERFVDAIKALRPTLVHFDRPDFAGEVLSIEELRSVAATAAAVDAPVLIDESAAPYLGPASSAIRLVGQVDNLIVCRGFTKAYSWGGLRVGFAVASRAVAPLVRELVPPLQVGELAFVAALRLLKAGDIFGRLRARIRAVKPLTVELFKSVGAVSPGHPDLPWVTVADGGGETSALLGPLGIRGLRANAVSSFGAAPPEILRLTIPISDERVSLLRRLLLNIGALRGNP